MTLKAAARNAIVDLIGRGAEGPAFGGLARRYFGTRSVILVYHAVWREGDPRLALFGGVTDVKFREDLARLARIFRFVSLDEAIAAPAEGDLSVCVTFDDGFDLVAGGAAEALRERGARATAFVNTRAYRYEGYLWQHALGLVKGEIGEAAFLRAFNESAPAFGAAEAPRWEAFVAACRTLRPAELQTLADHVWSAAHLPAAQASLERHRPYMDAQRLREWTAMGHDVGFHSRTHAFASALAPEDLDAEYVTPGRALAAEIGKERLHLAYPFGDRASPANERALAQSCVFASLIGTDPLSPRGAPPETIGRLCVDGAGLTRELFGEPLFAALTGKRVGRSALS